MARGGFQSLADLKGKGFRGLPSGGSLLVSLFPPRKRGFLLSSGETPEDEALTRAGRI